MSFQNFQKAKSTTEKAPRRKDKSESQDESPEGEDSEEDEDRQEEEDDDDEEEDDDDDEEDEEEEEESDDEDEEEEENEEEGNESEDSNEGMVSIRADAASLDDVEKASVAGEKNPDTHISDNRNSRALSGDENCVEDLKTRTQQIPGASYAIPVTFDVEHDYVVSAVRVESKFSDDDESLGKESKWSTEQYKVSSTTLIGKTSTFPASSEEEIDREAEKDKGSPRNKSQISGVAVWTDSSDEVDSPKKNEFGPNERPADQTEDYGVEDNGSSDVKNDAESHKWTRRSSQVSLSGQCSPGLPHYNKTAADAASDDSCWDSSSKSNGQNVHRPFLINEEGSVVVANNPGEQQCLLDCCEVASLISIDRVSDEPSAFVPPVPDKEDEPKKQIQVDRDIDSCGWLSKKEMMEMGNDQIDGGSLDDEDNSWGSTVEGDVLKTPYVSKHTELEEVAAVDVDDGSSDLGEQHTTDDITTFENCDSRRNCADDLLPQTDIDDVDLDSSDETKSVVERRKEVKNTEGPITQVKQENVR